MITNNNGVSTTTTTMTESGWKDVLAKLDQLLQVNKEHVGVATQQLRTPPKIALDSRELATIQNIGTSRT